MTTIFVTQEGPFDYTPAQQFGDVVFLTRAEIQPMKGSLKNEALVDEIRFKLQKYDPMVDWILPSGSPYVTGLIFAILGQKGVKDLRMLRWSNRDNIYAPLYISI